MTYRPAIFAFTAALLAALTTPSIAQDVIRIGDINSYKAMSANLGPYRKGVDLAVEQINAAGGVLGKKLEIVSRDDGANPGDAVRMADDLRLSAKVDVLTGTILSHVGLDSGNRYTFRLRPSTYSHAAALVPHAAALKRKRWAFVFPNYEYGQSAVATFKSLLKKAQPDVEFVADLSPPLGKIDSASVVQSLADAKPDAVFNVLFGADLAKFVRDGETRGLFKNVEVVSLLTGEPEYLDPLKDEAPVNWYVTGYPWYLIKTPEHLEFLTAYQKRYNDYPRISSVVGYATIQALAAGIAKAKSTNPEALAKAFEGLTFKSPSGDVTFRAIDHQATLGLYVGRTGLKDGKGVMTSYDYVDGSKLQPTDEEVRKLRPADTQ